ncbi:cysteine desulfurase [Atopobacter sp. AH10]|uniref:cysteine desulfurase n=1 Tax=Atopobacter sp. AH10 TaxID=2315861 RepID=UPI000EF1FE1E|nr:cysteine desulfurase [Atopobacter sp. AH10]RLK62981.1 cysteine desulfurase [Atopobacter sp. AH10]
MAIGTQAQIKGIDRIYAIHPDCKKYTLRDNGFTPLKNGRFEFLRNLDTPNSEKRGLQLRAYVDLTSQRLSLSVVGPDKLRELNLAKLANPEMAMEKLRFILENFEAAHILRVVEKKEEGN